MRSRGLTLLEVLIAIAIIGVAFGVLVLSQALNYRVSARARALSELKAEAIRTLEERAGAVLEDFLTYYDTCLSGEEPLCHGDGWRIQSEKNRGIAGEGLVRVTAWATDDQGGSLYLVTRVSCYDTFASRTAVVKEDPTALQPCPPVTP